MFAMSSPSAPSTAPPAAAGAAKTDAGKPKKPLTPKELAKQEKAARRAAQKEQQAGAAGAAAGAPGDDGAAGASTPAKKGNKGQGGAGQAGKGGKGGQGGAAGAGAANSSQAASAASQGGAGAAGASTGEGKSRGGRAPAADDALQPFLHLDLPKPSSSLSHSAKLSTANIHPSILRLALQYSEFKVVGANARCIAMLEAFKDASPLLSLPGRLAKSHLSPSLLPRRSSRRTPLHRRLRSPATSRLPT